MNIDIILRVLRKGHDMHKNKVVECTNSCIKNNTLLFKFGFKILNSGMSRLNPKGGRLKD